MARQILDENLIHPAIRVKIANYQQAILQEVKSTLKDNDVVVVGMAMNPFPRKACKALDALNQPYKYLEYGSYLKMWKPRGALKMWTGWPTFPMIFVKGTLIGGFTDLCTLIDSGELRKMLAA
jgi:monothiol glutaredoxin